MALLALEIFFSVALLAFLSLFISLYNTIVSKPRALRSQLEKQGISGPTPSLFYGNIPQMKKIQSTVAKPQTEHLSHDYSSSIFPYFELWRKNYGPTFMYSTGYIQNVYVTDPATVREIALNTSLDLGKPTYVQKARKPLFGNSILTSSGAIWAHQRKIIAPQFFMDKVKGMIDLMVESSLPLVNSWGSRIQSVGDVVEIRVHEDLRSLSADIISKACFGSSYSKGKEIFQRLRDLQTAMAKDGILVGVPGMRYLPTKHNREVWKLEKEVDSLILKLVKERKDAKSENDLLQMILEGANSNEDVKLQSTDAFIVDNCKGIYFAGHETAATSCSWVLMLLAAHPDWQTRVRNEVVQVCGGSTSSPDINMLRQMKTLTMVIQEAVRLYPPAPLLVREALQSTKFGDLYVPKGVCIWIPLITLHQDPQVWGPGAMEFNPDRFSQGISNACKIPQVYMPFGTGPRTCVGQNFAMVELKIIISLIVSRFSFSLSPNYRHSPAFTLVIEPNNGVDLLMKKL